MATETAKAPRDDDGNVIDPPTIPEYERRIFDAAQTGDTDLMDEVTKEYTRKRAQLADKRAARQAKEGEAA